MPFRGVLLPSKLLFAGALLPLDRPAFVDVLRHRKRDFVVDSDAMDHGPANRSHGTALC